MLVDRSFLLTFRAWPDKASFIESDSDVCHLCLTGLRAISDVRPFSVLCLAWRPSLTDGTTMSLFQHDCQLCTDGGNEYVITSIRFRTTRVIIRNPTVWVFYEYIFTLECEVRIVWRRKVSAVSVLLLSVRWAMVLSAASAIFPRLHTPLPDMFWAVLPGVRPNLSVFVCGA